jgi:alpha-1,3-mannosyltransferase
VAGIPIQRLPWRGSSRYPLAPSVLWHLQSADVVHVHAIDFFLISWHSRGHSTGQ